MKAEGFSDFRQVNEMNDITEALRRLTADPGGRGVLVEIAATEGSSPRTAGARMLLGPDGAFTGTVGGGGLEYLAQQEARRVLGSEKTVRRLYSLGDAPGEATGAVCGGAAELVFRPIGPGEAAALMRELPPPPRAFIFGAGHVGKALADTLCLLGMTVVVTDERREYLTEARFPGCERRLVPLADAPVDAEEHDFAAVMTHGHAHDYEITLRALRSPAHYVGMIGSRKKSALFRERFLRDGVSREDIDRRLRSPVGLPIGAETPEEIAISIAAEIIQDLRGT